MFHACGGQHPRGFHASWELVQDLDGPGLLSGALEPLPGECTVHFVHVSLFVHGRSQVELLLHPTFHRRATVRRVREQHHVQLVRRVSHVVRLGQLLVQRIVQFESKLGLAVGSDVDLHLSELGPLQLFVVFTVGLMRVLPRLGQESRHLHPYETDPRVAGEHASASVPPSFPFVCASMPLSVVDVSSARPRGTHLDDPHVPIRVVHVHVRLSFSLRGRARLHGNSRATSARCRDDAKTKWHVDENILRSTIRSERERD
eukprot:scaffold408_cov347-Pavlova_lutheri.AAC.26